MNSKEFAVFCNPSNYTAQILLAHFFLIEYYIDMSISLDSTHVLHFRRQVMPKWIEKVADALSPEHVPYMKQALDLARSEPIWLLEFLNLLLDFVKKTYTPSTKRHAALLAASSHSLSSSSLVDALSNDLLTLLQPTTEIIKHLESKLTNA